MTRRRALHPMCVLAAALAALAGSSLASSCSSFESALQRFWNFGIEPRAPFSYALRGADWGGDCSSGAQQSPVALWTSMDDPPTPSSVTFMHFSGYDASITSGGHLINNGHGIEMRVSPNTSERLVVSTNLGDFHPVQFHFHTPSEHTIDGREAAAELHIVHTSEDGQLLVIGILLRLAAVDNPVFAKFWNAFPHTQSTSPATLANVTLSSLLPVSRQYFNYLGSLTTPGCSETVNWVVMESPGTISPAQLSDLSRAIADVMGGHSENNRPLQALNGRPVYRGGRPARMGPCHEEECAVPLEAEALGMLEAAAVAGVHLPYAVRVGAGGAVLLIAFVGFALWRRAATLRRQHAVSVARFKEGPGAAGQGSALSCMATPVQPTSPNGKV